MPRHARLDAEGVLHHIIIRGIERRLIFRDDVDKNRFVERMGKILTETGTPCYAWAFLGNHAHFLLKTGKAPLYKVMARLLTGHALAFNKRHRRHGQLFQNRYKSILCQEDAYLSELVCYIHLNPLRAGIVKNLADLGGYPYSGHPALMGEIVRPWQDADYVLLNFGASARSARQGYLSFMESRFARGKRPDLTGGGLMRSYGSWTEVRKEGRRIKGDERILGGNAFVQRILSHAQEKMRRPRAPKMSLKTLAQRVGALYEINPDLFLEKNRKARLVEARSLFCFWAVRNLGYAATTAASFLRMTQPGVGYAADRGEAIAREKGFVLDEA